MARHFYCFFLHFWIDAIKLHFVVLVLVAIKLNLNLNNWIKLHSIVEVHIIKVTMSMRVPHSQRECFDITDSVSR